MLTTSKYPRYSYLRRLMVLPLLAVLCVLFALKIKQDGNKLKETLPLLHSQTPQKQMEELDFKEQKPATTVIENAQQKDQKLVDNGGLEDVDKLFLENEQDTTEKSNHQQDSSASSKRYKPAIVILDGEKMSHEEFEARKIDRNQLPYSTLYTKYDKLGEEGKNGVLIAITKQQGPAADKLPNGEVWKKPLYYGADTKPYREGREALLKYIKSNLNYPEAAKKKKMEVRVTVTFVVEADGTINYFAPGHLGDMDLRKKL